MKNNRKNRKLLAIRAKNNAGIKVSNRMSFRLVKWYNEAKRRLGGYKGFTLINDASYYPNPAELDYILKYTPPDMYRPELTGIIYP